MRERRDTFLPSRLCFFVNEKYKKRSSWIKQQKKNLFWNVLNSIPAGLPRKPVTPTLRLWTIRCLLLCLLNSIALRLTLGNYYILKEETKNSFIKHQMAGVLIFIHEIWISGLLKSFFCWIYAKCGNQFFYHWYYNFVSMHGMMKMLWVYLR